MGGSLAGKAALVTGGGRGIGRAIALALAREGADVAVFSRSAPQIEEVACEIRGYGRTAAAVAVDVANSPELERAIHATVEKLGKVDILVNNASGSVFGAIDEVDPDVWWNQLEVNVKGAYTCSRALVPSMIKRSWGRVINVASRHGKIGAPQRTAYCAAKHALIGFTRALALEVATTAVTVNAVCPGMVETTLMDSAIEERGKVWGVSPEEAREQFIKNLPQKKLISLEEFVPAVMFLVSEGASRITGEALNISGGSVMH
jgi:NAD(P)-dependent dehydrogenase (short-subunit alcohol dehydrogenase family)